MNVIYDHDGCGGAGPLYIVDGLTGKLKSTIDYLKEGMTHCQGFSFGEFNTDSHGLELGVSAHVWIDAFVGELVFKGLAAEQPYPGFPGPKPIEEASPKGLPEAPVPVTSEAEE